LKPFFQLSTSMPHLTMLGHLNWTMKPLWYILNVNGSETNHLDEDIFLFVCLYFFSFHLHFNLTNYHFIHSLF
jgi:hypothetical protein